MCDTPTPPSFSSGSQFAGRSPTVNTLCFSSFPPPLPPFQHLASDRWLQSFTGCLDGNVSRVRRENDQTLINIPSSSQLSRFPSGSHFASEQMAVRRGDGGVSRTPSRSSHLLWPGLHQCNLIHKLPVNHSMRWSPPCSTQSHQHWQLQEVDFITRLPPGY